MLPCCVRSDVAITSEAWMTGYQPLWRRPIAHAFRRTAQAPVRWSVRFRIQANLISYSSVLVSAVAGVLLAGWSCAELNACGGGALLRTALAEHVGWHGGAGVGHRQPRWRTRERTAGPHRRRYHLRWCCA